MSMTPGSTPVSPCTGVCRIDNATGFCLGCARTGMEIAVWRDAPIEFRDTVWAELPERFAILGITCQRLPWDSAAIHGFALSRLQQRRGTWVMGVVGAVAEVMPAPGTAISVQVQGDQITAVTTGGALTLRLRDDIRALSFAAAEVPADQAPVALVVLRERGRLPVSPGLTDLGPDRNAVDPAARNHRLFDLGLGRKEARFCVRCSEGPLADLLHGLTGSDFATVLRVAGPRLVAESPVRVVESALGRAEVSTPIPPPAGQSILGPHTHLLPDHLATGRAMPPGLDIPRTYLPGLLFYPGGA